MLNSRIWAPTSRGDPARTFVGPCASSKIAIAQLNITAFDVLRVIGAIAIAVSATVFLALSSMKANAENPFFASPVESSVRSDSKEESEKIEDEFHFE